MYELILIAVMEVKIIMTFILGELEKQDKLEEICPMFIKSSKNLLVQC